LNEKIDLDHFDKKICSVLFDHPEGLGFNDLLRKTGLNKKTLNNHLILLVKHEIIKKEKLRPYPSAPTRYTLLIDKNRRKSIELIVEKGMKTFKYIRRFSKVKQYEMTPFILQFIANSFFMSVLQYLIDPQGKILYQIYLNKLEELLDEYKVYVNKNFSVKAKENIFYTSNLVVYPFQNAVNTVILSDIEKYVNKQRTFEDVLKHMLSYDRKKVYQFSQMVISDLGKITELSKKSPKELKQLLKDAASQQNFLKK